MQVKQEPEDEVPEEPTTPPAVSSDYQPIVTKENPLMGQMGVEEVPVVQEDVEMEAEEVTEREEPAVHQPPPLTEKEVKEEAEEELNAGAESAEKGRPIGCGNEALKQENTAGEGVEYEQPIDSIVKEELEDEGNGGGGGIPQGIQAERHQTTTEVKEEPEEDAPEESTTPPAVSSEEQPVVTKEKPLIGQMEMDEAPVLQEDVEMEAEEVTEREEPGVHQPVSKRMRMGIEDNIVFPAHIDANEVDFPPNQVDLPLLDDEDGLDGGLADFDPPPGVIHSDDIEDQEDGRDLGDHMEEVPVEGENRRRKNSRVSKPRKFYGEFIEEKESDGEESSEESDFENSGSEDELEEKTGRISSSGDEEEQKEEELNHTAEDDDSKKGPEVDGSRAAIGELKDKETDQMEEEDEEEMDLTVNGDDSQILNYSEKQCPVYGCSDKLSSEEDLKLHMSSHTKPHHCRICRKSWQKPNALRKHYRSHTGEKPLACTTCKKTFFQSSHLKDHIRSHTGERPFECDLCDLKFKRSSHLKRHRRSHTGERPYAFPTCTHRCKTIGNLANHLRTHTGEKPFACTSDGCDFKSAQQWSLIRHAKRCHK